MKKNTLIVLGLIGMVAISCKNPEKRIRGTWRSVDTYIDEKKELTVSDNALDIDCGNMAASLKIKVTDVYYTLNLLHN